MKVAICTLGCKVNQYETQALEQELLHRGHTLVDFEETADAYVVNTCSVTAVSDKKSRQMLRQAQRRNPSAVIAACGCYAQTHPEDVKKLGLDVIAGTNDRAKFIDLLERAAQDKTPIVDVDDVWERRDFEVLPAGGMVNRTRAMLKVEDGCVNFCTYCLIPYARGRVRSLPMDEAAKQVKALREEGYREIVVTGIEISSYGSDFKDGTSLIDLLELIAREGGDMRIRLGSLEPRTITEEFCKRASKLPYLCPHFHLSMQSGCDATLKRMNRKYDTARYMESCDLLRQYFDDPAITTDLITGFPEETEEEFRIGCMTTLRELECHERLNQWCEGAVKDAVSDIVGVQFRNLATIGGSIFGRYGFSDVLTVFLAMDSYVELYKGGIVPLQEFAQMKRDNDILVRVIVKKDQRNMIYLAHRNSKTDFPVLTCAVSVNAENGCVCILSLIHISEPTRPY